MDKTERELAPARAFGDAPDGRDVAILDSVSRVRLAGLAVCDPPRGLGTIPPAPVE